MAALLRGDIPSAIHSIPRDALLLSEGESAGAGESVDRRLNQGISDPQHSQDSLRLLLPHRQEDHLDLLAGPVRERESPMMTRTLSYKICDPKLEVIEHPRNEKGILKLECSTPSCFH